MAKEQKAIAKLLDKDGITVNFWRFSIKNVNKILNQVLEILGRKLGITKDDLKKFKSFVIQETESDGTVIDTVFECNDEEFLDLIKEDYKSYYGYYPNEDKYDSERWDYIIDGHKGYKESKKNKNMKKSIKEKLNDNGAVQYDDIYSCELKNVLEVTIYDKELYEELRKQDLVIYGKGTYENIDWKMFQVEINYLRDDINASDDFDMKLFLANGTLLIDIVNEADDDLIMELRLESKFVQ